MSRKITGWLMISLLVLFAVPGVLFAGEKKAEPITREQVVAFVNQAVDYARKNGKEKALAEFMRQNGPFVRDNLYIFAYDYDGKVISHGGQPELVGKNLIERTDTDGKKIIRELVGLARQGQGWLRYNWEDRLTREVRPKLGYVAAVDDTWWLGSGLYEDEMEGEGSFGVDARSVLGALIEATDNYLTGVLSGMEVLSNTEAVKSGDWDAMRPLLTPLAESSAPGVYFFVRPDGSYYTTDKGLVGKNISDRPYFPWLMAGKTVKDYLVVSRSTGKKSAVLGVPVVRDGQVVGALGASVFLNPLDEKIRQALALPSNQFFFVMDGQGRTVLHQNREFLFIRPADMGSPSLAAAVRAMLKHQEGSVRWYMAGLGRIAVYRKSSLNGWCFGIAEISGLEAGANKAMDTGAVLEEIHSNVSGILEKMGQNLSAAAKNLGRTGLEGPDARNVLSRLYADNPLAVDCATVSAKGRLLLLEPKEYFASEGADISGQEQVGQLLKTRKPVLSGVFRAVEGMDAVDMQAPVFSEKGDFVGSVSILFRPETLLAAVMGPSTTGRKMDSWAMQTDGSILFASDDGSMENWFQTPRKKVNHALAGLQEKMLREKSGYEKCTLHSGAGGQIRVTWSTVDCFGTQWRLAVSQQVP